MKPTSLLVTVLSGVIVSLAQAPPLVFEPQTSGVTVRLRGVSAVSPQVAWASGAEGTVLRTLDGGRTWVRRPVPGAGALDFRDLDAMSAEVAYTLSIGPGDASRIFAGCDPRPLHIDRCGTRSNRRSQARRRSARATPLRSSRCHGDTPVRRRCVRSRTQCAHFHCGRTTTSTIRMRTRIMAERRRRRTGPGRRNWVRARAKDMGHSTNGADESLRAFIRALARQAARECFELELKQRARTIQ